MLIAGWEVRMAKISVTSPIVINMPTRELLVGEQRVLLFNVLSI